MTLATSIHAIILAAGESKRFHGIKQLACLTGEKISVQNAGPNDCQQHVLIKHACEQVTKANFQSCQLMLGANAKKILPFVPPNMPYSIAHNWSQGIGKTIATAMQELSHETSHVCIILADQVKLKHFHFNQLIAHSLQTPEHIISAQYNKQIGVPSIFPAKYFSQLANLQGDVGAKNVINQAHNHVVVLEMPEAAFDIDTQKDLLTLHASSS